MSKSHHVSRAQDAELANESSHQFHVDNLVVDTQVRLLRKLAESAASLAVRRLEQQASAETEK
jgi:hypothetical protein